ncbi:MAG: hypothetical protein AAF433_14780 [Bacteroidota bacterium]
MDWIATLSWLLPLAVSAYLIYAISRLMQRGEKLLAAIAGQQAKAPTQEGNSASGGTYQLQAYERLSLLMERMSIPNLMLRNSPGDLSGPQYTASLLHTIRTEFEHNVTQQVYVSDQLWEILILARDNVSQLITRAAEGADTGKQVANRLLHMSQNQPQDAVAVAQAAIRREAAGQLNA